MAIDSIDREQLAEMARSAGYRTIIARLHREAKMLRAALAQEGVVVANSCCRVCFRDFPHSKDIHDDETRYIRSVPNFNVGGRGGPDDRPLHDFVAEDLLKRRDAGDPPASEKETP